MDSVRGKLILAGPMLKDPNFDRTVVLITEHNEDGAMGLVLNRPSEATVGDAVPDLTWVADAEDPIYVGGPVAPNGVIVLAEWTDPSQAVVLVEGDLGFVPGDADDPDALAGRRPPLARLRRARRLGSRPARGGACRGGLDHRDAAARGAVQRGRREPVAGGPAAHGAGVRAPLHDAAGPVAELTSFSPSG